MKLNPSSQIESIDIILTPEKYPIAYQNKLDELLEEEAFNTKEEAEQWLRTTPITLELYYEKGSGLFAVESDALEGAAESICSPYSKEPFEED